MMRTVHETSARWLAMILLVICSSGATCLPRRAAPENQPPIAFNAPPDLAQLAEVINRTQRITQLESNAVSIRSSGVPTLSARVLWERPLRFRMTGGVSRLTGTDFDLGSNDEAFWMATRHGPAPTLYFARHDQFAQQLTSQILPVSPGWLIEAMGIVSLDPSQVLQPPAPRADGLWEIESAIPQPAGTYRRTLVVDPKTAVVRQVLLRDPTGRLLASSLLSNHQYYESVQVSLPHALKVQLIPSGGPPLELEVDVGYYALNNNQGNDPLRWTMPREPGYTVVDLVQLNQGSPVAVQPPGYAPPQGPMMTTFRGPNEGL